MMHYAHHVQFKLPLFDQIGNVNGNRWAVSPPLPFTTAWVTSLQQKSTSVIELVVKL